MLNYWAIAEKLSIENVGLKRQLEGKDVLIKALVEKVYSLEDTIKKMEEELGTLKRMHFGTSSEKTHSKVSRENAEPNNKTVSATIDLNNETSPRPKKKRIYKHPERRNYEDIPVEKVIELSPDAEEIKGAKYVKTVSSYRFYWIPGRLCKVRIDRKFYSKDGHLIYPDLPYVPETFEKRHADPTLAAAVLVNKYLHHIPYERQLNMINQGPFKIAKTTLFDCAVAGIDALEGVYEAIKERVLQDKILHIDETTQNMINKEEHKVKKGYDWGFISQSSNLMFFARSNGSRKEAVLDEHLKNFNGYIHTDGYGAYTKVAERTGNNIIQIPCMSHIRRKFWDAIPYHKAWADEGLQLINRMFTLERLIKRKKLKPNEVIKHRRRYLKFLLDRFRAWLSTKIEHIKEDNIGKAIQYAWSRVNKFYELLYNSKLELSNNKAERTMRSHAMGRKNYLFCWNELNAERTCIIYSVIESCKLCKIDPTNICAKYSPVSLSLAKLGMTYCRVILRCDLSINLYLRL